MDSFPDDSGYLGHVITGAVVSTIPLLAEIDTTTLEGRLLLAAAGGMGAAIAIIGDRPKSINDGLARIVVGVFSCFLFAPWIARRVGLDSDLNGNLLVFGLLGVCSWYVTGSVTRGLSAARDSGSLWRAILAAIRQNLPGPTSKEVAPDMRTNRELKSPRKKPTSEPSTPDRPPTPTPEAESP